MKILRDIQVPMRDNVRLATDVYLPEGPGPWPVVLERTPYGKHLQSRSEIDGSGKEIGREKMAAAFVAEGMAVVYQDCRGRYGSEGEFEKYVHEAEDGFDTLAWLVEQTWCNGDIGTQGLSYAAHTQLAAACLNPPGLRTMVLDSGGFDNAYRWGIRQGGAFDLKQATWAFRQSKALEAGQTVSADELRTEIFEWFDRIPWSEGNSPLAKFSEYEAYLLRQWREGAFGEYWDVPGLHNAAHYEDMPVIPVLFMSSWFDVYVPSTLRNYQAFVEKGARPSLIMGPWLHGDRVIPSAGDMHFGTEAVFDVGFGHGWLEHRVQWLRSVLVDGVAPEPSERVFEMGSNRWVDSVGWPSEWARELTLYPGLGGTLLDKADKGSVELIADPAKPVPMVGGQATSGKPVFVGGSFNQVEDSRFFGADGSGRALVERDDVLSFATDVLEEDVVVAGSVTVEVHFNASTVDFDIAAKLVDVHPDGSAWNVTDGIQRARYRDSFSQPTLVEPGVEDSLIVELPATCMRFKRGHRIRIDLAGSNFPHFDVNPNSGEPEGYAERPVVARTQILLGESQTVVRM
ncbi:CocE/NonD family hydrolase [Corynebacterium sp. HMSC05E07]|uniref:CocE/NonD family hydrolase n=1 Tax=Corynebacterium sp. HMSC05E07 TaxID=1581117 RepID=UPI0008A0FDE3|nr:CocE/NonD family hydrolase [Corynebacterium sp. HMSC05E07]OFT63638.1 hypothetical protein HMPREF3149_00100 [Corynebacterium sp. HMSC05E07]